MNLVRNIFKKTALVLLIINFQAYGVEVIDQNLAQKENIQNSRKLMELASAHILARAIHVAAGFKIADHLVDGPCHIHELAYKVNADHDALYRLLRLLASNDIFFEDEYQNFSLTPLAMPLISDHTESLQSWLANHDGDEKRWRSYGHMAYSVQTGKPAFNHVFGQGYFDFISQDANMAKSFDEGMRNLSEKEDICIAGCYDFSPYTMVTDIGGGKGGLISAILKLHPTLSGVLYDLPHVQISADAYIFEQNLTSRTHFKSGSFFDEIPFGSDVYVLKRILHDWDDELCIQILSNCRKAMKPGAKLLIIEAIVAPANNRDFAKDVDLAMLVLFGGKERTQKEWEQLLNAANLKLLGVYLTPSMLSILEIVPN
ncbi:MAG: methyltransferase [Candidatus Chromulinivorax sp.]|nr:methyltransferase [Candidatus Chromulinivorax sp.]